MISNSDKEEDSCFRIVQQKIFFCPLTKKIMKDPVSTPNGYTFERKALLKTMRKNGSKCPLSGKDLNASDIKVNVSLQWETLYWERKNDDTNLRSNALPILPSDPAKRVDAPPCMPSRSISANTGSRKRIDSPPCLPRRKISDTTDFLMSCRLPSMLATSQTHPLLRGSAAHEMCSLEDPNDVLGVLDEVVAIFDGPKGSCCRIEAQ